MFSDKYRILTIVILAALILAGCFYGFVKGPEADPSPHMLFEDVAAVGQDITVRYAKIKEVDGNRLLLKSQDFEFTGIKFGGDIAITPGQDISIDGTILGAHEMTITDYHVHPWRPLKYYFSLPAVFFIAYLLFRKYRFDCRRFMFFEKKKYA